MATLTSTQRTDMQGDLGISNDEAVFTNDELDRLYTRANSDYNLAVYYAYRQLMSNASKFFDYTEGETEVKKSQIMKNVQQMVEFWRKEARQATNQVLIVGTNEIPPRWKDKPTETPLLKKRRPSDAVD